MAGSTENEGSGRSDQDDSFVISVHDAIDIKVVEQLRDSLATFNKEHAGPDDHTELLVVMRDPFGELVGGLVGGTYYGYLHVDWLWVDLRWRGKGLGSRLLKAAELEAVRRGCMYAHLDTHGFQALTFYLERGYTIAGELKELPPGDSRYLLRKVLKP